MDDRVRVGIHIAAPATAIVRGDALDQAARARMSTVYAPGVKITMLPEPWIEQFSLAAGKVLPVLSCTSTSSATRCDRSAARRGSSGS